MSFHYDNQQMPGDKVWICIESEKIVAPSTIIANQKGENGEPFVLVRAEVGETTKDYKLPEEDVFYSFDDCLAAHHLAKFDCEIFLSPCVSRFEQVVATDLESAIAGLKEKYPEALSVSEIDHWR